MILVAIPGFNLEWLNPKEFAVFSFVSSRAIALERPDAFGGPDYLYPVVAQKAMAGIQAKASRRTNALITDGKHLELCQVADLHSVNLPPIGKRTT
jgi:hypothetical protein